MRGDLVVRQGRRQRPVSRPEADHLLAVADEAGLHEELDVAVGVGAGDVETGGAAPGDVAQACLHEPVADVAGVHEADRVELDDRPLVAMPVALDPQQAGEVAVALVHVQEVVRPEGPQRQPEEGEDADRRARQRQAERAGARSLRTGPGATARRGRTDR